MSDATLEWMRHNGVPITRENYVQLNWMEVPDDWDAEHEHELPEELQDWPALLKMHEAAEPAQDEFNPSEARDPKGEWTAGGAAPSKAGGAEAPAAEAPKLDETSERKLVSAVGPRWKHVGHIPRASMPQIPSARIDEFKDWMQREGVKITTEKVKASSLQKTQEEINQAAVDKNAAEMLQPNHSPKLDKPVLVSRDGYILDGHHTWAARAKNNDDILIDRFDMPIKDLLENAEVFTGGEGKRDHNNVPQASVEDVVAKIPGAAEKCEQVEAKIAAGTPTDATPDKGGFKNEDGTWTAERERLHQQILRNVLTPEAIKKAIPPKGQPPQCVVLGGRGGAGKSYFTSKDGPLGDYVNHAIYINADDLQEKLPGYEGWNAALYHEEASHIADLLEQRCRTSGLNVIHDATMRTWISSAARIAAYQRRGYAVKSYFVDCKPETSVDRAVRRFMSTGRYVSPTYLMGSTSNLESFKKLRDFCDDWQEYTSEGVPKPKLVESKANPAGAPN